MGEIFCTREPLTLTSEALQMPLAWLMQQLTGVTLKSAEMLPLFWIGRLSLPVKDPGSQVVG